MTLSRKIAGTLSALVALVALVGIAAVWGLMGLSRNLGEALDEYEQLRAVYEVAQPIIVVRGALLRESPDFDQAEQQLRRINMKLAMLEPMRSERLSALVTESRGVVVDLADELARSDAEVLTAPRLKMVNERLNRMYNGIRMLAEGTRANIDRIQRDAKRRLWQTKVTIGVLAGVTLLVAIVIGVVQYRTVMRPVRRIGAAAERLAGGDFTERLQAGDDELGALAMQFNRMADELESLYADMERRINESSRQLVLGERLASVGFLAAGVAHEINNPLGIITGQAELAERRAERAGDTDTAEALRTIRDEAFRCSKITQKLLALSRGGTETRQTLDLVAIAQSTIESLRDLPRVGGRRIELAEPDGPQRVHADESQMKQVLLNLLTNAVEATDGERGEVSVSVGRLGDMIALTVADNGRGLDEAELGRVFEPFYTDRRGANEPGTGLGLSITHAVVAEHGGTIRATSDGPGRGARFIVELPALAGDAGPGDAMKETT